MTTTKSQSGQFSFQKRETSFLNIWGYTSKCHLDNFPKLGISTGFFLFFLNITGFSPVFFVKKVVADWGREAPGAEAHRIGACQRPVAADRGRIQAAAEGAAAEVGWIGWLYKWYCIIVIYIYIYRPSSKFPLQNGRGRPHYKWFI